MRLQRVALISVLAVLAALPQWAEAAYPGRNGIIASVSRSTDRGGVTVDLDLLSPKGGLKNAASCLEGDEEGQAQDGLCAQGPAWSADGRKLAFATDNDLMVARPDGKGRRRIAMPDGFDASSPAWSPDGRQLLFAGRGSSGRPDLYVVGVDGGPPTRRTTNGCDDPAWSVTGRIACNANGRIMVTMPGSDGLVRLARGDLPDWSPSGRFLVYQRRGRIYRIGARRGAKRKLLTRGDDPVYSPDGKRIAFTRTLNKGGGPFTHLMVARSSGRRASVRIEGSDDGGSSDNSFLDWTEPAWQPRPR